MAAAFLPSVYVPLSIASSVSPHRGLAHRLSSTPHGRTSPSRWHMTTPPTPTPTDPSTGSTGSTEPVEPYSFDTDLIVGRAKAVVDDVTDRPAYYSKIFGYIVGAVVVTTVLRAVVSAIDALPFLPGALELIGLGYTAWFVWRYVLFSESRTELVEEIDDFLGRTRPDGKDEQ